MLAGSRIRGRAYSRRHMPRRDRAGTLIVGAGVAGLGAGLAAHERRLDFQLVEAAERPGGLVQTDELEGFYFDRTAHVLHLRLAPSRERFRRLGVPLRRISRRAAVVLRGELIPYPIQYNLWALRNRRLVASLLIELAAAGRPLRRPASFAELLGSRWGEGLVSLFFRPYNEKLWGRRLEELPAECAGDYLPEVDLELARRGATGPTAYKGYNGHFLYPASGRLGDIVARLAEPLRSRLSCAEAVVAVDLEGHEATTSDGRTIAYDRLVGASSLPRLLESAGCMNGLAHLFDATAVANVRVALRGRMRTPLHWVYVPDAGVPFHRVAFPRNLSSATCPPGCVSLSIEYTLPCRGRRTATAEIADAAVAYAADLGLIEVEELQGVWETLISPAYVLHRAPTREELSRLRSSLADRDVHVAGRFGEWDYLSIEQSFVSGTQAVQAVAYA
jgi:protoporphyrinogen oxidase